MEFMLVGMLMILPLILAEKMVKFAAAVHNAIGLKPIGKFFDENSRYIGNIMRVFIVFLIVYLFFGVNSGVA